MPLCHQDLASALADKSQFSSFRKRSIGSTPQGLVAFNTNVFDQPLPASSAHQGVPTRANHLTSIECYHQHAKILGRYPKLGLWTDDDVELAIPTPLSFGGSSSPTQDQTMIDTFQHPDWPSSPPSQTLVAQSSYGIEQSATPTKASVKRKAVAALPDRISASRSKDVDHFYEGQSDDDSDVESSVAGSEYCEERHTPSASTSTRPIASSTTKRRKLKAEKAANSLGTFTAPTSSATTADDLTAVNRKHGNSYKELRDKMGRLTYQCLKCPEFSTRALGDMGRHLESLIHQPASYFCNPECGKVFTRKDALIRHAKKAHPGEGN